MSLIKTKSIQLGWDLTPTNNFTIYQPATPDGTFRIATGNAGSTTDVMTVSSTGSVTYAGTVSYSGLGFGTGSATAPSIFPNGDTNTGLYFPTAETIGFSTNGTERLRIDTNGVLTLGNKSTSNWVAGVGVNISTLQVGYASFMYGGGTNLQIRTNGYYGGSPAVDRFTSTGSYAYNLLFDSGMLAYDISTAVGTADTPITYRRNFTVDVNGNMRLGVGNAISMGTSTITMSINGAAGGFSEYQYNGTDIGYIGSGPSDLTINTFAGHALDLGVGSTYNTIHIDTSNKVGIGIVNPAAYSVNNSTCKLVVNGPVHVVNGATQTLLNRYGWAMRDSGGSTMWIKMGTFQGGQSGQFCSIKFVTHIGFNADAGQTGVTHLYFKTANGSSWQTGGGGGQFYGDATAIRMLGANSPSGIRIIQVTTSSYDIWAQIPNYSVGSFFEVTTSSGQGFVCDGDTNQSTAPTYNTYIDVTISSNTYTSDEKYKDIIEPITNGLSLVNSLQPFKYKWKADVASQAFRETKPTVHYGLGANATEKIVPEIVETGEVNIAGDTNTKSLRIEELIPILISAVQELSSRVSSLEGKL